MIFYVKRTENVAAGHFLRNYTGPCARPHGHNYNISVEVGSFALDSIGMVIDFSRIKEILKRWDHVTLNDLPEFSEDGLNPTAENIAFLACLFVMASCHVSGQKEIANITTEVAETQTNLAKYAATKTDLLEHFQVLPDTVKTKIGEAAQALGIFASSERVFHDNFEDFLGDLFFS